MIVLPGTLNGFERADDGTISNLFFDPWKSFTPTESFVDGWYSNVAFLVDFVSGTGGADRVYGPSDIETASLANSKVINQMMEQVLENCGTGSAHGAITTPQAANNASSLQGGAPDPLVSPAAFQLGAFTYDWQVNGNSVNLTVNNPATLNSFFYHIPSKLGIANKKSGMFRTINQTFNLSFDNPCH